MAGNTRYEFTSASPESGFAGNYQNGQRGYSASTLDRSTSFRDGMESRNFASGKANSRGSTASSGDGTALSQYLILDQIVIDQKYARFSDIRRVLAFSIGGSSEDNSLGTAYVKNPPPAALEEMKRLKASITDSGLKASSRAKKFDDQLNKLNKYLETVSSKKQQQRNEMLTSERSGGSTLKIGSLMHRNPADFGSQKFDDRPKNGGLNKRVRTSVAETRADFRNNGAPRQPLTVTKERDLLKDSNVDSEIGEEKMRLPAGGEGWDKKMKRKRSVGAVFPRSVDNDGELKRTVHHKLTNESSLQSGDSTNSFRSGTSGGSNKRDPSPPAGSSVRATIKNEQEKPMLSRDGPVGPIKERTLGKLSVRINNREENHAICPSPVLKGKASRTPRSGSVVAANSSSAIPRVPGTLESWDQPQAVNRTPTASGAINRKRPVPAGSSSPPITQWGGQRPQKSSRTRRTNLIPVPNHDDVQMQAEGGSPSDFSPRLSTGTTSGPLPTKSSGSGNQNSKAKPENVSSPARLSESEESGSGQFRVKEKGIDNADAEDKDANTCPNVGPSTIPVKKNKIMVKDETGDGVRRQGRSGRVSPFSRTSISSTREKLETVAPNKPLRNARSGSDKNGSKSGRPLKKLSDRKGFSRLGHMANGSSPDCSGESEDDREDLLDAANLAWNSSLNACSSAFWKTVESLFASIGPDEIAFLSEQLKLAEESSTSSHQNSSHAQEESGHEEIVAPDSISFRRYGQMKNGTDIKNSSDRVESVEQLQNSSVFESSGAEKASEVVTPLYQRVLSALIEEDEIEESEETGFGMPSISVADSRLLIGVESKHMDKRNLYEPSFGVQIPRNGNHMYFSCNGNADFARGPSSQDHLSNGELHQRESGYVHSEVEVLVRLSRCDYVSENVQTKNCGFSSFHHQYEQMSFEEKLVLELQSIGLFVEAVALVFFNSRDSKFSSSPFPNDCLMYLHNNALIGPIPEEIGGLVNLWELQLQANILINGSLPKEIGNLTSLTYLLLNDNELSGEIPKELFLLKNLVQLNIGNNQLRGWLPREIGNSSVQNLWLHFNQLSGPIPSTIGNQPGLVNLALYSNNLSGEIPSSICRLRSPKILYLSKNNLQGEIPGCLGNLSSSLVILHLNANNLSGLIPSTFTDGCSLQSITVNGNKLKGTLPQSLINCRSLQGADFGDNEIQDTFPFWMEPLPNLRVLVIRSNKFNGTLSNNNANTQHPFPKLQVLDISLNEFTGSLPERYFENFRGMVDAEQNQTDDNTSVFRQFIELTFTLKGLDQSLQRLLTTFTTLDLSSNRFSGNIPASIGYLNSLRYLNLSHNSLTGQIPASLGNISVLESLDLSTNNLSGRIPQQLTGLTFLAKLNLSSNNLVGQIPQSRQFNTFDNSSYMGNSGLCGVPLTKKCGLESPPALEEEEEEDESGFVNGFGWQAVVLGYGCGLVIGLGVGYFIGIPKWLVGFFLGDQRKK